MENKSNTVGCLLSDVTILAEIDLFTLKTP